MSDWIVGADQAGRPVISGAFVFRLRDTYGMPLEGIVDEFRRRDLGWDVPGYLRAALASGNFTRDRLQRDFDEAGAPPIVRARVRALLA